MTRKQVIRWMKQLSKKLLRKTLLVHIRTSKTHFLQIWVQLLIAPKKVPAWPKTLPAVGY